MQRGKGILLSIDLTEKVTLGRDLNEMKVCGMTVSAENVWAEEPATTLALDWEFDWNMRATETKCLYSMCRK